VTPTTWLLVAVMRLTICNPPTPRVSKIIPQFHIRFHWASGQICPSFGSCSFVPDEAGDPECNEASRYCQTGQIYRLLKHCPSSHWQFVSVRSMMYGYGGGARSPTIRSCRYPNSIGTYVVTLPTTLTYRPDPQTIENDITIQP